MRVTSSLLVLKGEFIITAEEINDESSKLPKLHKNLSGEKLISSVVQYSMIYAILMPL